MSWTSSEITEWIFHCKKCTEKEKKMEELIKNELRKIIGEQYDGSFF